MQPSFSSLYLLGLIGVVSYRLIKPMRYSRKQLYLSGFTSGFAELITKMDNNDKRVTMIANLCYVFNSYG